MRPSLRALLLASLLCALARPAQAEAHGVGLGAGVGLAAPFGKVKTATGLQTLHPNFGWGFYVDIPLAYGFNLTPHAELYNVANNLTATDIGLAFKFIIETPAVRPYFGLEVGDTNLVSQQQLNVGGLAGANIKLIANLDAFVEARYIEVLREGSTGGNVGNLHVLAGLLFRF
jgi:hypothetical protein